jgi:hypothetical protein
VGDLGSAQFLYAIELRQGNEIGWTTPTADRSRSFIELQSGYQKQREMRAGRDAPQEPRQVGKASYVQLGPRCID